MTASAIPARPSDPPPAATAVVPKANVQAAPIVVQMPPEDHRFDYINTGVSGGVGLVAAFIGAYLGYRLTKKANADARALEQREKDEIATFALYLKLNAIYTAVKGYRDHFNREIDKARADGIPDDRIAAAVQPFANDPDFVKFDHDELYRLSRVGGDDLVNDLVSVDEQHNGMVQTFARYRDVRLRLQEGIVNAKPDGGTSVVFELEDPKEMDRFQVQVLALNDLVWQAKAYADKLTAEVFRLMLALQRARSTYTGRSFELALPTPEGKEETFEFRPLVRVAN